MTLNCPCEIIVWQILPSIRRELARRLIQDFGLSQKESAEKLKVTPAAICQYISKKRGKNQIDDIDLLEEIKKSSEIIINKGEKSIIIEICRICKLMRERDLISFSCENCKDD